MLACKGPHQASGVLLIVRFMCLGSGACLQRIPHQASVGRIIKAAGLEMGAKAADVPVYMHNKLQITRNNSFWLLSCSPCNHEGFA